ncbi:MAG: NAD(P)H-binding protein [Hyphomicrobiaceae bacterium]|nr:NAD(P)H-binding protein [Hyphomicrobiaceae bacterium]
MRILITGATGYIGRALVEALDKEGDGERHDLVLASRARPQTEHFRGRHEWRFIDFAAAHSANDWRELVKNIDVVINSVGIFSQTKSQRFADLHDKAPRALFKAAHDAGVKRVIQISALGTDERATSAYHLSKKRADDALARLDMEWVILRPSLVIGKEGVSWRFFQALAALPFVPVIADGRQILQPVSIDDVARAVLMVLKRQEAVGHRINLVGSERVTLEQYLRQLSNWQRKNRFRPVHMPYGLSGLLAITAPLIGNFPFNRDAVNMLKEARAVEPKDCQQRLGFQPAGLSEYLLEHPLGKAQSIEARQYFLRPFLRLSLAFMWIMAGVASLLLTPHAQSLALLSKLGLQGLAGTLALYGAAFLDVALGIALLARFHIRRVAMVQIALIAGYTLALTIVAPFMWSDPFGVLVKNFPLMIATMLMRGWQEE